MWCRFPPPLTDDQITALLDNAAEPAVREHIQRCDGCAARLAQARRVEQTLFGLRRFDCPPAQVLGDYHIGLITGSQERAIVRHLEQCALCTTELEELRVFLTQDVIQQQPVPAAPPAPRPAPRPRLGELVARLLPRTAGLALRGAAAGPIMAEAGNTTIMLDVQPVNGERVTIMGQIVADEYEQWIGALVELRQANVVQATTTVDDLGTFTLSQIRRAPLALRVTPEQGQAIVVEQVELAK